MREDLFRNILLIGLGIVIIFAPIAKGAVQLWSITVVELVVLVLVFLWLWLVNNRGEALRKTKINLPLWLFVGLGFVSTITSIAEDLGDG